MQKIAFTLTLALTVCTVLISQQPFNCTNYAYLFQYNDVYAIDLASGQSTLLGADITSGNINAVAYNTTDGYIWGHISSPSSSVVRVGADLSVDIYTIPGYRSAYVGAIDSDGLFYSKGGGASYDVVDLNPMSVTYLQLLEQRSLSQSISIADWAFNPLDGMLYTASSGSNRLYRIDPVTGLVTDLGEVPVLSGFSYTYGAVYFDVEGHFYVSANQTGSIYRIEAVQQVTTNSVISSNIFAYGPASASNDGARCPTATVPTEICDNNIDDDGDGLIDCDDPSCSGVASCPALSVSSGSNGGLESNNRLSQAIAKRNYNRHISPIEEVNFEHTLPDNLPGDKILNKSELYLSELLPVGLIDETHAIESSPSDLIDITNAVEVFSVDYYKEAYQMATILALRTNEGVYEHSKFICDRLLGAELNSVSTIYVNEQPMIRSIIYRPDGRREFVLSLAARVSEEGVTIESHWNLDRYKTGHEYFNFQIWTEDINQLIFLAEGILDLIAERLPIVEYRLSDPPRVFVQRAMYNSGKLSLQVMNNDFSTQLIIEGGSRRTETSNNFEIDEQKELEPYKNMIELEVGQLFDLGFRVSTEQGGTPDDLFVSDGPWGYDDAAIGTDIIDFVVTQDLSLMDPSLLEIERDIHLEARLDDYVAVYRAMTPRFEALDLDVHSFISFTASGIGQLEVTLVKESVTSWEEQLHAHVSLEENGSTFTIRKEDFKSQDGTSSSWEDIKLIVFTIRNISGEVEVRSLDIADVGFGINSTSTNQIPGSEESLSVYPNPTKADLTISIDSETEHHANLKLVNAQGVLVHHRMVTLHLGQNGVVLETSELPAGSYMLILSKENELPQLKQVMVLY